MLTGEKYSVQDVVRHLKFIFRTFVLSQSAAQETAKAGLALHMAFEKCATADNFL